MNDEFYIVWNPSGNNPQTRHITQRHATNEAERLARTSPGSEFFVLRAESVSLVPMQSLTKKLQSVPF
jgi:hypothetical protein